MIFANTPESWSERATLPVPEAVGWSEQGQQARFAVVLEALDPQPGETLLDYGCGTGALADHLPDAVHYVGYDWAEGMVVRAAAEHPDGRFQSRFPIDRFDLVAAVGPFNLRENWSKERTWHILRHLWDTTGCRALAASLYAGTDERLLVYTETELGRNAGDFGIDTKVTRHRANDLLFVARR